VPTGLAPDFKTWNRGSGEKYWNGSDKFQKRGKNAGKWHILTGKGIINLIFSQKKMNDFNKCLAI